MGTTRWASGALALIPIVDAGGRDCRIDIIGAEGLRETLIGNTVEALDLTVHMQLIPRGMKAIHFIAKIAQMPVSTRDDIIEAIEGYLTTSSPFPVVFTDAGGVDDISVLAVPDYAANGGRLYARGGMAAGYVKQVEFRLVTVGPYVPEP